MFICGQCGYQSAKWLGRCPECLSWESFEQNKEEGAACKEIPEAAVHPLSDAQISSEERLLSGIEEFDRVLGGGIVPGEVVLIAGEPGIGKSTLLLEIARSTARKEQVLYVSAEESLHQIRLRAQRLGITEQNLMVTCESNFDALLMLFEKGYSVVIIDSIQVLQWSSRGVSWGGILQIKEMARVLVEQAKAKNISVFIVGHVTKEGVVSGPKALEHIVDAVIYFEGEKNSHYRILRAVKNRFGSTGEIGVFEMTAKGLMEVKNPSSVFLRHSDTVEGGSAISCVLEGTRALMVEIQVLVGRAHFSVVRRKASGFDFNRFSLIAAMLEKKLGFNLVTQDIFVNVASGVVIDDPAADLALAVAIASSYKDFSIPGKHVFIGEVGLLGELRPVAHLEARIRESKRLGFETIVFPQANRKEIEKNKDFSGISFLAAENVRSVFEKIQTIHS